MLTCWKNTIWSGCSPKCACSAKNSRVAASVAALVMMYHLSGRLQQSMTRTMSMLCNHDFFFVVDLTCTCLRVRVVEMPDMDCFNLRKIHSVTALLETCTTVSTTTFWGSSQQLCNAQQQLWRTARLRRRRTRARQPAAAGAPAAPPAAGTAACARAARCCSSPWAPRCPAACPARPPAAPPPACPAGIDAHLVNPSMEGTQGSMMQFKACSCTRLRARS